jgi:transposase InsO family protein
VEDGRCKLGLAGRLQLVRLIESGCSLRSAAAESSVSPATAHRWWHRWQQASELERASRECLRARAPRPKSCPWQLSVDEQQRILDARQRTNYGPARLAGLVGYRRSTIHKVLVRHGCSRRRRAPRERSFRRYEWAEPGALLHMDTKRLQRFAVPGHWATGDRREIARNRDVGYVYAHCVVDDHSRLAYVELLADERAGTVTAFVQRALEWFGEHGITARRLMTDGAFTYTQNRSLRERLARDGIRHLVTEPYRPATNGKVERFHQTMTREWAKGRRYETSDQRNAALAAWLHAYNHHRPHGGIDGHPPISRVHDLPEHNI